jgi:hypothetical protein
VNERSYGLGCLKDPVDRRDMPIRAVLPRIAAPARVDYSDLMSPVRDQGAEGTCVAFAAAVGLKEYQERVEHRKLIGLSPRDLYFQCKKVDGIPNEEGTYIRVAMKVLSRRGVCLEECWPYRPYQTDSPCPEADRQARPFRIKTYGRLTGIEEMEESLSFNGPFLAGVEVFEEWFEARGGKIPLPRPGFSSLGGHAVCVVGYDHGDHCFKFKNSWSASWGDGGYGYLPFEYMERYCLDAWSATDLIAQPDLAAAAAGRPG